ncbi:hypothetical protein NQ318_015912 [Aromia moschata]|uniref:Transposase n=1 Tax=Aromia moschata TaxID=1265417 RepID=A0AAV8Y9L7_9CUCU|nr:hypothetical protein NQ318_015912 [Aromia moschata]
MPGFCRPTPMDAAKKLLGAEPNELDQLHLLVTPRVYRVYFDLGENSLQEALEIVYAEDDVDITAIYTEPPEISVLSDEDSGAEDDDGDINRLSGCQLRAAVEIQEQNNVRINSDTINQGKDYDIDTQEPLVLEVVLMKLENMLFKNAPDPNITYEEIKCAIAIVILSGYDVKPARRYYWDSKSDMGYQLVIKG